MRLINDDGIISGGELPDLIQDRAELLQCGDNDIATVIQALQQILGIGIDVLGNTLLTVYVLQFCAKLTVNEYKIVALLGKYAGKVLTYDFIIRELWGPKARTDNQILRVNMANIRRKLEANPGEPKYIFTELGIGYRMLEDENLA